MYYYKCPTCNVVNIDTAELDPNDADEARAAQASCPTCEVELEPMDEAAVSAYLSA